MGIITKFPSQSKTTNMTPTAPITGNPAPAETTQVIQSPFFDADRIIADIPDNYMKKFHVQRLPQHLGVIMVYHPEFGSSTTFTPNPKTQVKFEYTDAANEHDLPLVKRIEIFEIGKFTITMTIHTDMLASLSTYIWY